MIIVSVWYSVKPGMRAEVMKIAKPSMEETRKEKGNIQYAQYPSMENEQDMFVFEVWESKAAIEAHIRTPHYLNFAKARKPMLVEGSYRYTMYEGEPMEHGTSVATW